MALQVVSFATYLTDTERATWRRDDYNAHDFVRAIKGREIREYAFIRCRDAWRRFENTNREDVVMWFGEMVAGYAERHPVEVPFALVPVPESRADVRFAGTPRTVVLARAISAAVASGPVVLDALRWDAPIVASRLVAGTRDAATLYARLVVTVPVVGQRVVLVDDVITLGGHVRACAAKLREAGAEVVLAICAGRADRTPPADPFAVRVETLEDFVPAR